MNTPFKADLHCHSTCSDGTLTPKELIALAKSIGLKALSITDHDTVEAYQDPAVQSSEDLAIITGVEFSTTFEGDSIHLLGYRFDPDHSALADLCHRHKIRREERNHKILELLQKHEMPLTEEDLAQTTHHTVGRPHIAMAMVKKGYVRNVQEAFKKYLGEGCCCYHPGTPFSAAETIEVIHVAGGIAVIAHPHLIKNNMIIRKLLELPFDGLECIYGNFTEKDNKRWIKIATERKLLITGGSDFHGEIKPAISLGASYIDFELLDKLIQK